MSNQQQEEVLTLLRSRRDKDACQLIKTDLSLVNEEVIRLALDNGCVKTIRLLRQNDLITIAGKEERERQRRAAMDQNITEFDRHLAAIEKLL